MTTTDLIELLKKLEHGASGRPREISIYTPDGYYHLPDIKFSGSGDGVAGAELLLKIQPA